MTDWEIVQAMERYGGSFIQALAVLSHRADEDNLRRIKAAWPEYWQQYSEMAELSRKRDAERVF